MGKSALSELFQAEFFRDQASQEECGCNGKVTREHEEERKADTNVGKMGTTASSFFQLPFHYPKYTRKDYEEMPEWKLDCLLAQYGLLGKANWNHIGHDLAAKREIAIGTFLWPEAADIENCPPSQGSEHSYDKNVDVNRIVKMMRWGFGLSVIGFVVDVYCSI